MGLWEEGEEFSEDEEVDEEAGPSNTSSSESETRGPHADDVVELETVKEEEEEFEQEGVWPDETGV